MVKKKQPLPSFAAGRISLAYWLVDMPLHFLFGLEVRGSVEMRPSKLARRGLVEGWQLEICFLCFLAR